MEKSVHEAQRIIDSDTVKSSWSISPSPIVWFLFLLLLWSMLLPVVLDKFPFETLPISADSNLFNEAHVSFDVAHLSESFSASVGII